MDLAVMIILLSLLGAVFGSFAGAQVWRLRLREHGKGELDVGEVSTIERKKLAYLEKHRGVSDRSRCLMCGHQLAWYDLLPIVSWLWLRGRCRYCKENIGYTEFLLEISLATVFVASYFAWPFAIEGVGSIILFGLWLIGLVLAAILLVYDLRWLILPDRINYTYALVGLLFAITALLTGATDSVWSIIGSVGLMSGLYLSLYLISRGAWVGFGDVKLGIGLGLFLLDWKLALVSLFLANFIGTIVIMPLLLLKRISRKSIVPFGPFLLIGTLITVLFGRQIIELYFSLLF